MAVSTSSLAVPRFWSNTTVLHTTDAVEEDEGALALVLVLVFEFEELAGEELAVVGRGYEGEGGVLPCNSGFFGKSPDSAVY